MIALSVKLTRVIHANHADASHSAYHSIRGITAQLQQIRSDVAANITLRGHGA